jgi:hypothetical protein
MLYLWLSVGGLPSGCVTYMNCVIFVNQSQSQTESLTVTPTPALTDCH